MVEILKLKQQHENIRQQMLSKLKTDNCMLKQLADEMAECATNIHGQGYTTFVNSREKFLSELDRLAEEYSIYIKQ